MAPRARATNKTSREAPATLSGRITKASTTKKQAGGQRRTDRVLSISSISSTSATSSIPSSPPNNKTKSKKKPKEKQATQPSPSAARHARNKRKRARRKAAHDRKREAARAESWQRFTAGEAPAKKCHLCGDGAHWVFDCAKYGPWLARMRAKGKPVGMQLLERFAGAVPVAGGDNNNGRDTAMVGAAD